MKLSITKNKRITGYARRAAAAVILLLIWQLVAMKVGREYIIPSPSATLASAWQILTSMSSLTDILFTLGRMCLSFALSFIIGTILSVLCYRSRAAEMLMAPLMSVIKAVPTMGVILLSLIWFRAEGTVLFVTSLIIVPVIYSNMLYGMKAYDPKLLEMGRLFRLGFKKTLKHIYIPSLRPFIGAALASGISLNMKVLVAAEVFGQPEKAIGTNLFNAKAVIDTPAIFAWSMIVILIAYAVEKSIAALKTGHRPD